MQRQKIVVIFRPHDGSMTIEKPELGSRVEIQFPTGRRRPRTIVSYRFTDNHRALQLMDSEGTIYEYPKYLELNSSYDIVEP